MNRRRFLTTVAGAAGWALISRGSPATTPPARLSRFKAIAFDAFPILDPRPVFALAERLYPGHGAALSAAWKVRQFDYTWLRAAGHQYTDFWQVTQDALVFAARETGTELTHANRDALMDAYLQLKPWPDVVPVLRRLKQAGIRMAFLSNLTPRMLERAITGNELAGLITEVISTDAARTYKPDPQAYQLGIDRLGVPREQILFVAFAGWDAAGAKWFGYPTFWVNRLGQPTEELSSPVDGSGRDLHDLESFLTS